MSDRKESENLKAFRIAYYDLLYHYDNKAEKEQIKDMVVKKENIVKRVIHKIKSFFFFY